jgi:hypothetical protein
MYLATRHQISKDNTFRLNSSLFSEIRNISGERREELVPRRARLTYITPNLHLEQVNAAIHTETTPSPSIDCNEMSPSLLLSAYTHLAPPCVRFISISHPIARYYHTERSNCSLPFQSISSASRWDCNCSSACRITVFMSLKQRAAIYHNEKAHDLIMPLLR